MEPTPAGFIESMRLLVNRTCMTAMERRRQSGTTRERRAVAVLCALLVAGLAFVPSTARRVPRSPSHPGITVVSVRVPVPAPVPTTASPDAPQGPFRSVFPHPIPGHQLTRLHLQHSGRDGARLTTLPPPALLA